MAAQDLEAAQDAQDGLEISGLAPGACFLPSSSSSSPFRISTRGTQLSSNPLHLERKMSGIGENDILSPLLSLLFLPPSPFDILWPEPSMCLPKDFFFFPLSEIIAWLLLWLGTGSLAKKPIQESIIVSSLKLSLCKHQFVRLGVP